MLDVGCGEGELVQHLADGASIGVDNSPTRSLAQAPNLTVRAEATALRFSDASFGSIALLYVLYHLPEATRGLNEARRVLRPGGLLVAVAAPSRHDSPELAHALPRGPLTFDAELASGMLAELFTELEPWDAPLLELARREAVRDYQLARARAAAVPGRREATDVPLSVTKRGALAFARKTQAAIRRAGGPSSLRESCGPRHSSARPRSTQPRTVL